MKAAVWTGIDKIEIQDLPMPTLSDGETLIKVNAAGVCVTDYHIISGKLKIGKYPNVQGHEICGEVVETKGDDYGLKKGQRCVIATSIGCGKCAYCRDGKQYLCKDSSEIGYYPHNGGYAEYLKVPTYAVVPIPKEVSNLAGAILESCVCPTESIMRAGVKLNSTVFVTGVGPAGLAYIMLAKLMGAGKVIALVRGDFKSNRAKQFGADLTIDTTKTPDFVSELLNLTNGEGAELVLEATGASDIITKCVSATKKGGTMILYGIPGDNDQTLLPVKEVIVNEITIMGAVGNTKAWYPLAELIKNGKLDLEPLVTHKFKLEDINKAFDLYRTHNKELIKAVIEF